MPCEPSLIQRFTLLCSADDSSTQLAGRTDSWRSSTPGAKRHRDIDAIFRQGSIQHSGFAAHRVRSSSLCPANVTTPDPHTQPSITPPPPLELRSGTSAGSPTPKQRLRTPLAHGGDGANWAHTPAASHMPTQKRAGSPDPALRLPHIPLRCSSTSGAPDTPHSCLHVPSTARSVAPSTASSLTGHRRRAHASVHTAPAAPWVPTATTASHCRMRHVDQRAPAPDEVKLLAEQDQVAAAPRTVFQPSKLRSAPGSRTRQRGAIGVHSAARAVRPDDPEGVSPALSSGSEGTHGAAAPQPRLNASLNLASAASAGATNSGCVADSSTLSHAPAAWAGSAAEACASQPAALRGVQSRPAQRSASAAPLPEAASGQLSQQLSRAESSRMKRAASLTHHRAAGGGGGGSGIISSEERQRRSARLHRQADRLLWPHSSPLLAEARSLFESPSAASAAQSPSQRSAQSNTIESPLAASRRRGALHTSPAAATSSLPKPPWRESSCSSSELCRRSRGPVSAPLQQRHDRHSMPRNGASAPAPSQIPCKPLRTASAHQQRTRLSAPAPRMLPYKFAVHQASAAQGRERRTAAIRTAPAGQMQSAQLADGGSAASAPFTREPDVPVTPMGLRDSITLPVPVQDCGLISAPPGPLNANSAAAQAHIANLSKLMQAACDVRDVPRTAACLNANPTVPVADLVAAQESDDSDDSFTGSDTALLQGPRRSRLPRHSAPQNISPVLLLSRVDEEDGLFVSLAGSEATTDMSARCAWL